jgi:hypothetical protein
MGFRSTLTSLHYVIDWPEWFVGIHGHLLSEDGLLCSRWELKAYMVGSLAEDVQLALIQTNFSAWPFVYVWLHECGGVTRVEVGEDYITAMDPVAWRIVGGDDGGHGYCYGCTDLDEVRRRGDLLP